MNLEIALVDLLERLANIENAVAIRIAWAVFLTASFKNICRDWDFRVSKLLVVALICALIFAIARCLTTGKGASNWEGSVGGLGKEAK